MTFRDREPRESPFEVGEGIDADESDAGHMA